MDVVRGEFTVADRKTCNVCARVREGMCACGWDRGSMLGDEGWETMACPRDLSRSMLGHHEHGVPGYLAG
jgi:hypothetical protein